MIRVVLFDIDGTLIRTGGAGRLALDRAFALQFGIPDPLRDVSLAGRTDSSLARDCFRANEIPVTSENLSKLFDTYVFLLDYFLHRCHGATCAGVLRFIEGLRQMPHPPLIALLTGNILLGAEIKLRHFDLWPLFEFGAFADDHEDRNCLAEIAKKRAEDRLGRSLAGDEILVVGDTPLDVKCARAIGAHVLAVATGDYSCADLLLHTPTWVVEHLGHFETQSLGHGPVQAALPIRTNDARTTNHP